MDFAFSEEQEMLRGQARDYLRRRFPPERVVSLADSEPGWDESSWSEIVELGWIGSGMTFLDEAVLFEEMGRALYPGPYFSTVALCAPVLEAVSSPATLAWAEPGGPLFLADLDEIGTKAEPANGAWRLTGEKFLVPDLGCASDVVVVARSPDGVGLFTLEGEGTVDETMDSTRRLGRLLLDGAPAQVVVDPGRASERLRRTRLRALAALALEAAGVASVALELSVEYTKTREQFGRPIGVYQGVSHKVSDIYMEAELARSLAYWAAWCVSENDPQAVTAAPAAKAFAAEAAVAACERAIQVHGGIGFTWEHILHRYYRRAQWIESFEGHGPIHRGAVASALLDRG